MNEPHTAEKGLPLPTRRTQVAATGQADAPPILAGLGSGLLTGPAGVVVGLTAPVAGHVDLHVQAHGNHLHLVQGSGATDFPSCVTPPGEGRTEAATP